MSASESGPSDNNKPPKRGVVNKIWQHAKKQTRGLHENQDPGFTEPLEKRGDLINQFAHERRAHQGGGRTTHPNRQRRGGSMSGQSRAGSVMSGSSGHSNLTSPPRTPGGPLLNAPEIPDLRFSNVSHLMARQPRQHQPQQEPGIDSNEIGVALGDPVRDLGRRAGQIFPPPRDPRQSQHRAAEPVEYLDDAASHLSFDSDGEEDPDVRRLSKASSGVFGRVLGGDSRRHSRSPSLYSVDSNEETDYGNLSPEQIKSVQRGSLSRFPQHPGDGQHHQNKGKGPARDNSLGSRHHYATTSNSRLSRAQALNSRASSSSYGRASDEEYNSESDGDYDF